MKKVVHFEVHFVILYSKTELLSLYCRPLLKSVLTFYQEISQLHQPIINWSVLFIWVQWLTYSWNLGGKKKTKFIKSEELNKKYAPCWKAKGVIFLCFKSWITWANSLFFVSANCTIRVRWYSAQKSRISRLQDPLASPPLRSKV